MKERQRETKVWQGDESEGREGAEFAYYVTQVAKQVGVEIT